MTKRLLLVPYTFVLMNWAAVRALSWYLGGRGLDGLWTESRRGGSGAPRSRVLHPSKP